MKKTPKVEVIKTYTELPCYACNSSIRGKTKKRNKCKACDGTGIYKEYHYMMIVGNNAIDMDTLK